MQLINIFYQQFTKKGGGYYSLFSPQTKDKQASAAMKHVTGRFGSNMASVLTTVVSTTLLVRRLRTFDQHTCHYRNESELPLGILLSGCVLDPRRTPRGLPWVSRSWNSLRARFC